MRALISVSDKTSIIEFASGLQKLGYEIISTGGTYDILKKNSIRVIPIQEVTDFPEILDGRVKTLHPKIHGGLLALRQNPEHMKTCKNYNIELIDIVVVNLYPFEKTIANKKVTMSEAIENIDIGGPSMIRSAAKNHESVAVIVNPDQYPAILKELQTHNKLSLKTKQLLSLEAFQHTGRYDSIIANFLEKKFHKKDDLFPTLLTPVFHKIKDLRYGENPHQQAAIYKIADEKGFSDTEKLNGKELSYNNYLDLDSAWSIVKDFELPACAIIKHTNPCGAGTGDNIFEAYQKALEADPVSAFGSIIAVNRNVSTELAEEMSSFFIEAIIAPSYDKKAIEILTTKTNLRLLRVEDFFQTEPMFKYKNIKGALLVQTSNTTNIKKEDLKCVTKKAPNSKEINDLLFAYAIVKYVKSNAIVIVKNGQTLGVGAGQMSRIDAVEIALQKAGQKTKGAILASDAFFPFKDSLELIAKHGIASVIQPGGSRRDQESIDIADQNNISMVFTNTRFFNH